MNQNQHLVQQALQRQFSKGKHVRVVSLRDLTYEDIKPKHVAARNDFQSGENESADQLIETQAFTALRAIKKGAIDISDQEREYVDRWVALHMSRNSRDLSQLDESGLNYDDYKRQIYNDSLTLLRQLDSIWTLRLNDDDEPLILSDNPVVRFSSVAVVVPFSPTIAFAFSNEDPRYWSFTGRSHSQAINEMSFMHSQDFIICHPDKHPDLNDLASRSRDRGLIVVQIDKIKPNT